MIIFASTMKSSGKQSRNNCRHCTMKSRASSTRCRGNRAMNKKAGRGLSILAGSVFFVGSVNAADLIVNGSFESVTGGTPQYGGITDGTETGWDGVVSSLPYSGAFYSGP